MSASRGAFAMSRKLVVIASIFFAGSALTGCATVFEGTSQDITVVSTPAGASCTFERQGLTIATIASTPQTVNVPKRKYDILIRCDKPGYQEATYLNHSGVSTLIAGNIAADLVLTAGLSSIVDSADGADNKYDSAVNITLLPINLPQRYAPVSPVPVPAGASSASAPQSAAPLCTAEEAAQEQAYARRLTEEGYQFRGRCN
jgi:hypothetical protein